MSKVQQQQTSFNGGVVSSYIEARPDIAKFFNSVRVGNNVWFMPEGGFLGRWGSRKVTTTKSDGAAYLFAFKPNSTVNYVLEFGNLYIRFYRDGAPLLVLGVPYEISTPYLVADIPQMLATGARESVDVLYLDADGYEPRKLSRFGDTNWTLTLAVLDPAPTGEQDWPIPTTMAISVAGGIVGFTDAEAMSSGTPFLDADVDKDFIYDSGKASITAVTTAKLTIDVVDAFPLVEGTHYVKKTTVLAGAGTTMTSTAHGLAIGHFVERATNVGTPTGLPSGEVRKVTGVTNANVFTIDSAFSANPNTGNGWYRILPVAVNLTYLRGSPQTTIDVPNKEPVGRVMVAAAGVDAFRPEDVGKIIKLYGGSVRITEYTSAPTIKVKIVTALVDATANPAVLAAGAWRMEQPIWSATRGYPTANEFHQGRLYHAGSDSDPTTIIGSRVNNYSNYSTGALATDAISYTHASGSFNKTHWLLSSSGLFFGNTEAEVSMRGSGVGAPIGGDEQPDVNEQSFEGSAPIRPAKLSKSVLYVGPGGIGIYALKTDNESAEIGKYKSTLANILARDIESPGVAIHPIVIMRRPFNVAFFKISSGVMLSLTNDDDEDVHAFSPWSTGDGEAIESFAVINHPDGDRDQIWMIVLRNINGVPKRYVEVLEDGGHDLAFCAYAQFVTDCAIKITKADTVAQTTVSGLGHLEGRTVDVMMYRTDLATPQNPRYLGQFIVTAGVVALNEAIDFTAVFEVGLPIDERVQGLRPGIPKTLTEGYTRKWIKLFLRLKDSIPPKVNDELMSFDFAVDGSGNQIADQGPKLTTGDKKVRSDNWHYDTEGYVTIERSYPGPFQVLQLYGEVDFTGDFK
jgi:hypothetical protein